MKISQQDQKSIKEHANYETGVCTESQFNFYNKPIYVIIIKEGKHFIL